MIEKTTPIPAVDPVSLRQALLILYESPTIDSDTDDADAGTMARGETRETLRRIATTLKVDRLTAIALFQRAIALSAFCVAEPLVDNLFEDGVPGRALCAAAAKAAVVDLPGDEDGVIGHSLDATTMRDALKNLSN